MSGKRERRIMLNVAYKNNIVAKPTENDWLVTTKSLLEKNLRTKMRERYISEINRYQKHQNRPTRCQVTACTIEAEPLPVKFKRLLVEWRDQAAHLSSMPAKAMTLPYQEIIGIGRPALPMILNELKERPVHLFWALRAISGTNPVEPEDRGRIDKMREVWLEWGRKNKIIE
jgi:hypothetical protein